MMVAVAIVAVCTRLGNLIVKRERFLWTAVSHRANLPKDMPRTKPDGMEDKVWGPIEWHQSMARKYEFAANHPWLSVDPDPPEPKQDATSGTLQGCCVHLRRHPKASGGSVDPASEDSPTSESRLRLALPLDPPDQGSNSRIASIPRITSTTDRGGNRPSRP